MSGHKVLLSQKNVFQWLGFAFISFVVLIAYSPSLKHIPRSDQAVYFANVARQNTWFELAIMNYDYSRNRVYGPGDEQLFRPVVFAILGSEKYFFGYHFYAWQITGIFLHLLVVFWFLKICLEFYVGFPAIAMTFLFAMCFANMEMVIWQHLHAYLFASFLILFIIYYAVKLMQGASDVDKRIGWILAASIVSVFIWEFGIIFTLIISLFLWSSRRELKNKAFLLLVPIVFYVVASGYDYLIVHHLSISHQAGVGLFAIPVHMVQVFLWWLYAGLFFYLYPLHYGIRTRYFMQDMFVFKPWDIAHPAVFFSVALAILFILFMFFCNSSAYWSKQRKIVLLYVFCVAAYILTLIVGRGNGEEFINGFHDGLYYPYFFWLFLMLSVFISIDWEKISCHHLFRKYLKVFYVVALVYGVYSGYALFISNYQRCVSEIPERNLISSVEALIKAKSSEPDFSFYVAPSPWWNQGYLAARTKDDPPGKYRSYIELLYLKYFKNDSPKYVIHPAPS